uniref:B2 mating type protein n=1 Tax=Heterobasidion annosum TaxID=13563 RepID=S5RA78_HETAN|nr:b2 mating type protein [Heterobasidion annosum]
MLHSKSINNPLRQADVTPLLEKLIHSRSSSSVRLYLGDAEQSSLPFPDTIKPPTHFPLPQPLTPDLISLGLNQFTAHTISQTYLELAARLQGAYEDSFRDAHSACSKVLLSHNPTLPNFESLMRSSYISHFMITVKSWAHDQTILIRERLLDVTLQGRVPFKSSVKFPPCYTAAPPRSLILSANRSTGTPKPSQGPKLYEMKDIQSSTWCTTVAQEMRPRSPRSIEHISEGLFYEEVPSYAFPKKYTPTKPDLSLPALSRGFQRVMRHSSHPTVSMNRLVHAFDRLSSNDNVKDTMDNDGVEQVPSLRLSLSTAPNPHSTIFDPLTAHPQSLESVLPSSSMEPRSSEFRPRKVVNIPKSLQSSAKPLSLVLCERPKPLSSPSTEFSIPTEDSKQSTIINVTRPQSPMMPSPNTRRRKIAALPTRRAPTSVLPSTPSLPITTPLALPMCPHSLSCRPHLLVHVPSSPAHPRLVVTSTDSGSSSSSDGLDTPPSTPPPFVTKFPESISPFSLSSKPFTPTFGSTVPPSNIFQFCSANLPKELEASPPSRRASPFELSTGIKVEEELFSFAFGR